jgi:hypothetical protein
MIHPFIGILKGSGYEIVKILLNNLGKRLTLRACPRMVSASSYSEADIANGEIPQAPCGTFGVKL